MHPTQQAAAAEDVLRVESLVKTFGRTRALDGLDLAVRRGEVHGFLGPNGSGKSTAIRVILGLMRADSGTVELFGRDPWRDAVELHARLAYVPGDVTLWPGLTGGQCIDILGRALGGLDRGRRDELVDRFHLDPTKRTRDYSKGNRQKVSLIAALASGAELLLLDEPTAGLDPLMEQVFQECVREAVDGGSTVLLSSHIMGEVEALADRVSIIREGRTVSSGTLRDLRRHTTTAVHAVTDRDPAGLTLVDGVDGLRITPADGRVDVHFHVAAGALGEATGILHGAGIHTLTATPPSLDDLFLSAYASAGVEGSGAAGAGTAASGNGSEARR